MVWADQAVIIGLCPLLTLHTKLKSSPVSTVIETSLRQQDLFFYHMNRIYHMIEKQIFNARASWEPEEHAPFGYLVKEHWKD